MSELSQSSFSTQQWLFSYGTLQIASIQLRIFGKLVKGRRDTLCGYRVQHLAVDDPLERHALGIDHYPILVPSGYQSDSVEGFVYALTEQDLLCADSYAGNDYRRVVSQLDSGLSAWVYIAADSCAP